MNNPKVCRHGEFAHECEVCVLCGYLTQAESDLDRSQAALREVQDELANALNAIRWLAKETEISLRNGRLYQGGEGFFLLSKESEFVTKCLDEEPSKVVS